jgi:phosphatidylglycerophosphate synthase
MAHLSAGEKANGGHWGSTAIAPHSRPLALAARTLTLARFASVAPFLWLFVHAASQDSFGTRLALVSLYGFVVLSDFLDGRLARRAEATSATWARADVGADVLFNFSSLAAAAWIGLIGPWVAGGVALLGGRFLWSLFGGEVREDGPGKLAGVLFYALVGWIVAEVAVGGLAGRYVVARAGDAMFFYTLVVFFSRWLPMSSRRR